MFPSSALNSYFWHPEARNQISSEEKTSIKNRKGNSDKSMSVDSAYLPCSTNNFRVVNNQN
jgi:hypothetical protein